MSGDAVSGGVVSGDLLRKAAAQMREDWESASPWLPKSKAYNLAVAAWLTDTAAEVDRMVAVTQTPPRGVDEPGGIFYGDPDGAAWGAALHPAFHHAFAVARAYLGRAS